MKIDSLRIGKLTFYSIDALKLDFRKGIAGVIGMNVISQANWMINYQDGRIILSNKEFDLRKIHQEKNIVKVNFKNQSKDNKIYFPVHINKLKISEVFLDTGFNGTIMLPMHLDDKIHWIDSVNKYVVTSTSGFGRVQSVKLREFCNLKIGQLEVKTVVFLKDSNTPPILGNLFLSDYILVLNNRTKVLGLIK